MTSFFCYFGIIAALSAVSVSCSTSAPESFGATGGEASGGLPGGASAAGAGGASSSNVGGGGGQPPIDCGEGTHACNGVCVSNSDPATCGDACSRCPTPPYTEATCDGSACGVVCVEGFLDCDNNPETGCEQDESNPSACANCPSLSPCCGNGDAEGDEVCDGADVGDCPTGACSANCECAEACPRLYFASVQPNGNCGELTDALGALLPPANQANGPTEACGPATSQNCVGCGYLYLGGGDTPGVAKVDRIRIPENVSLLYEVTSCTQPDNFVLGASLGQGDAGCTKAGCPFGPPLVAPVDQNRCVVSELKSDASGSINPETGEMSLNLSLAAKVYSDPCPVCSAGKCVGGASHGAECSSVNTLGTTLDCLPQDYVGTVDVELTGQGAALSTSHSTIENSAGEFCSPQGKKGAFRRDSATKLVEKGKPPGEGVEDGLALGLAVPVTLASTFCLAASNETIDPVAGLPGPGGLAIRGLIKFIEPADPCGDTVCDAATEDCNTCSLDCGACCGDGECKSEHGETCGTCELDCDRCPGTCGDDFIDWDETCDGTAYTSTCPYGCQDGCQECAEPMVYGVHEKFGADRLVKIDPITGIGTQVQDLTGDCPGGAGLAWNSPARTMYVIDGAQSGKLCTLDLTTGATTLVFGPQLKAAAGLTRSPLSLMYSIDQSGPWLYSLKLLPAPGVATKIGSSVAPMTEKLDALAFVGNTLYGLRAAAEGMLYTVNTSSAVLTDVGALTVTNIFSLATDLRTGELYATRTGAGNALYKVAVSGATPGKATRVNANNAIGFNKVKALQFGPP